MVPHAKKDKWWIIFVQKYYWEEHHHSMVVQRCTTILRRSIGDIVRKRKRSCKKPDFICLANWNTMLQTWEEEEHIKKSKINSDNATSNPDSLGIHMHTSGAKTHSRVAYEMEFEMGVLTHTGKDGTIIDKRAEALVAATEALAIERTQSSDITEGTLSPLQLTASYVEKASNSKGCIYGLGSIQYLDAHPNETAPTSIIKKAAAEEEMSKMKDSIAGLKQGIEVLMRMNGVDLVTYHPVAPRESVASSAPSAHSDLANRQTKSQTTLSHNS